MHEDTLYATILAIRLDDGEDNDDIHSHEEIYECYDSIITNRNYPFNKIHSKLRWIVDEHDSLEEFLFYTNLNKI